LSDFFKNISIEIRLAQDSDLEIICQNELLAYAIPWSKKSLKDCLSSHYVCFLMSQNNQTVGHMIFQQVLDEIHLLNVCVLPEFQKKGLGCLWIDHLNDYAKRNHVNTLILEVRASNSAAKILYLKRGFREIGLRKNYYQDKRGSKEDALVMKAQVS